MKIKMLDGSTFAFPNRRERIIFLVMVSLAALSVALIAYVSIVEYPLWFILVAVMVIVYAWFFHSAYKERKRKEGAEAMVEIKIKAGVIYHGNKKVGKIGLSELDTPNPQFIDYIEIFPQYRGRGFARTTIELLKSQYSEIIIGNPHENNPEVERIREFWRKMGFNTIGNFIGWKKREGAE